MLAVRTDENADERADEPALHAVQRQQALLRLSGLIVEHDVADAAFRTQVLPHVAALLHVPFLLLFEATLGGFDLVAGHGVPDAQLDALGAVRGQDIEAHVQRMLHAGALHAEQLTGRAGTRIGVLIAGRLHACEFTAADADSIRTLARFVSVGLERHHSEVSVRNSETRFRNLADAMPQLVWTARPNGVVDYCNSRLAEYCAPGRDADGCIAWRSLVHAEDLAATERAWSTALTSGETYQVEHRICMRDGSYRWHLSRAVPAQDADGNPMWFGTATDVHELRMEREAKERSEDRLRSTLDAAHVVAWDCDLVTLHLREAGPVPELFDRPEGFHHVDLPSFLDTVYDEDRSRMTAAFDRTIRYGTRYSVEFRVTMRDGSLRWLLLNGSLVRDTKGRPARLLGIARDVTLRKRAEASLAEVARRAEAQRTELQTIMTNLVLGLVIVNADGTIRNMNPAALTLLGYDAAGHGPDRVQSLAARTRWFDSAGMPVPLEHTPYLRVLQGVTLRNVELTAVSTDTGSEVVTIHTATPVLDGEGRLECGVIVVQDITARKHAEALLRQQDDIRRAIMENTTAALFLMNTRGFCTYLNPAAERMFGFSLAEITARPLHDLIHHHYPDGRSFPAAECSIDRAVPEGINVRDHEDLLFRKDGSSFPALWAARPLEERGVAVGSVIEVVDITQRKQHEEALRESDRRKDEFLATLAHELRNPLNPIRNAAHVLKLKNLPDPELSWGLEVINRQVDHLTRLIDDLLDVSRISRDRLELRREYLDIAEVVQAAVESTRPLIKARRHELEVTVPAQPVMVYGDRVRLTQVLINLLDNAAKYTQEEGHVSLHAETQNGHLLIAVRDNGPGVSREKLPRLFDMFYQGDVPKEQAGGGLGIGLTLVARLVQMHGGTVEAESAGPGKGCEFRIDLPIVEVPAVRPNVSASPAVAGPMGTPRRILVVDDNRDSAETLSALLDAAGNEVATAYEGQEALQLVPQFHPEVVLLDLGMPRMDGFETAARLREQPGGQRLCIIALTGWGQDEDRRRTRDAGFQAHIVKPVDLEILMDLLRRLPVPCGEQLLNS